MTEINAEHEAMSLACAAEQHYPFTVREHVTDEGPSIYGHVRTSSVELDGCGGRTDVHDLFSVLWAIVLRANGAASSQLIDVAGWTGFPELYERFLSFDQLAAGHGVGSNAVRERLSAHTALAWHALDNVIEWRQIGYPQSTWSNDVPEFLPSLSKLIRSSDLNDLAGRRTKPDWSYVSSYRAGVSIAVLPIRQAVALRYALAAYKPISSVGKAKTSIIANGLRNAVPNQAIRKGLKLIETIERNDSVPWKGADSTTLDKAVTLLPLESHFMLLGLRTAVIVRADCGLRAYEAERTQFLQRRELENAVFYADILFTWSNRMDGDRFEELVYALLQCERGVSWVRQSGPTRERDGGRDFIVRWIVPPASGAPGMRSSPSINTEGPAQAKSILVQVKAHRPSVGKSKVLDIRDTLERHHADGYFLVAFPQPAGSLVEHMLILAKNGIWTDWWDRAQLESRLRAQPDIAARFTDVVAMERANTA